MEMGTFFWKIAILCSVIVLVGCSQETTSPNNSNKQNADYIFTGSIYTSEQDSPWANSVVVKDDKIIAVGYADADLN